MSDVNFTEKERDTIKQFAEKEKFSYDELLELMVILRKGCPWDREQTHESIRMNFLEEAYETCDAIDNCDSENLCEELGDVMLQVVFHALIAKEENEFDMNDVISGVCKKLVLRHPHIFGDVVAENTKEVLNNWDNIKAVEKGQKNLRKKLDDVPRALPALIRCQKLLSRAHKGTGYEYSDKLSGMTKEKATKYIGDTIFELCSAAKALDIDVEDVLSHKNDDFIENF